MNKKTRTRFYVNFDNLPRELFSIHVGSDGTLFLFIRFEKYNHPSGGATDLNKEHRFSIHPSHASPGTTIKRTHSSYAGQTTTNVIFVNDSKTFLLTPIYTKINPIPDSRYLMKSNPKDELISIGSFLSIDATSLVYSVYVSNNLIEFPHVKGHSLATKRFEYFTIGVYSCYANIPSTRHSSFFSYATSPIRVNGVAEKTDNKLGCGPISPTQISDLLLRDANLVAFSLIARLTVVEPQLWYLRYIPIWFHPTPKSLMLGRIRRRDVF